MTEQLPGELIYEYTIQSTGRPRGVPAVDAPLSGVADIPVQATAVVAEAVTARFQLAWKAWSLTRVRADGNRRH